AAQTVHSQRVLLAPLLPLYNRVERLASRVGATYISGDEMVFAYPTGSSRSLAELISDPGRRVNTAQLTAHLQVDRYGEFWLTDAIRPSLDLQVVPQQGFCMGLYRDAAANLRVPVLVASLSREKLFYVFLEMLAPLGDTVDVVMETS